MVYGSLNRPSPTDMERARRLLAQEAAVGSAHEPAVTAAARVYDKLHAHMAPLIGAAGVQLIFVRSAKLAQGEFSSLAEVAIFERATKLRELLRAQDPAVATESAAILFGTFFSLITAFIGERLATQVLRSAWPAIEIEEAAPRETKK